MAEQKAMEKEYERLIERRAELKGMANKTKYREVQERVNEINRGLKESTSKLVASLKENPNVSGNMIKVDKDRKELIDLLVRVSQELRDRGTFTVLTNKVDEEDAIILRFQQLHIRDKELSESISFLEQELRNETESFQKKSKEDRENIIHLKENIHREKSSTSSNTQFKKRESLAKVSSVVREFKLKERVLELRIRELEDQIKREQTVSAETKRFIAKKLQNLEDEYSQWRGRYEVETGERDRSLRLVMGEAKQLNEKLSALRERKLAEEAAERERLDREAADRAVQQHMNELLLRKTAAVTAISRLWRMFKKERLGSAAADGKKKKKKSEGKKK